MVCHHLKIIKPKAYFSKGLSYSIELFYLEKVVGLLSDLFGDADFDGAVCDLPPNSFDRYLKKVRKHRRLHSQMSRIQEEASAPSGSPSKVDANSNKASDLQGDSSAPRPGLN